MKPELSALWLPHVAGVLRKLKPARILPVAGCGVDRGPRKPNSGSRLGNEPRVPAWPGHGFCGAASWVQLKADEEMTTSMEALRGQAHLHDCQTHNGLAASFFRKRPCAFATKRFFHCWLDYAQCFPLACTHLETVKEQTAPFE